MPRCVGLCVLALASLSSAAYDVLHDGGDVRCRDDLAADQLTKAVDAALMELSQVKGFYDGLKADFPSALMVADCASNPDHWLYPKEATATGLLKRVLERGELRMAGVQWGPYKSDSPAGFWPDYGTAIVAKMSEHYGKTITLVRVYYDNSKIVADKVSEAVEVDMSEPYYYLSGFHELSPSKTVPRIEHFAFSCITAATQSSFFTRKDLGITSVAQLNAYIRANPNRRKIGFIGQGNYDSVSGILAEEAQAEIGEDAGIVDSDSMEALVEESPLLLVAGYSSEGPEGVGNASQFHIFDTGIVSPRVILFREDDPECVYQGEDDDSMDTPAIVAIAVLGAIAILTSLALVVGVCYERRGAPIFMPISLNDKTPTPPASA